MTWDRLDFQRQRPGFKPDSEVVELRIVAGFYTYFGWFPWSDFEGESFSADKVYELTSGRAAAIDAEAEEVE